MPWVTAFLVVAAAFGGPAPTRGETAASGGPEAAEIRRQVLALEAEIEELLERLSPEARAALRAELATARAAQRVEPEVASAGSTSDGASSTLPGAPPDSLPDPPPDRSPTTTPTGPSATTTPQPTPSPVVPAERVGRVSTWISRPPRSPLRRKSRAVRWKLSTRAATVG